MNDPIRSQTSFLQLLIDSGRVRAAEAAPLGREAATLYPEQLANLAIEKGLLSEVEACRSLADFYEKPYIDLSSSVVDAAAVAKLDGAIGRELEAFPFLLHGDELSVAIKAMDLNAIERIEAATGCHLLVHLATRTQILEALALHHPMMNLSEAEQAGRMGEFLSAREGSPVIIDLATALVTNAARLRASDIHIEPEKDVLRVRLRVDGVLHEEIRLPSDMARALTARFKVMADLDIAESRRPQDGRITFDQGTRSFDLRISFAPTIYGEKTVIRLLDRSGAAADLRAMELAVAVRERLYRAVSAPNGIVLVTGPTGSGKSTTCYAVLEHLNSPATNIVTIEDPVEYRLDGLTQIQVQHDIGLDFGMILRSVLRQDPDIVLVGEIRDLETAQIATQAALTGHLVISTLHTNNAIQAVMRLVEMGVDPFMVAPSLNAVLAQRLARRICPDCRQMDPPSAEDLALFEPYGTTPTEVPRVAGCAHCRNTGYQGRLGVHEIVVVDESIRQLIASSAPLVEIRQAAEREGLRPMRYDALKKVLIGLTSTAEVRRVTTAPEDFAAATH
jgi:type IV pilus assembly protein PilB